VIGLNPSKKHNNNPTLKRLYKWLDILNLKHVGFLNLYEDYEINYKRNKVEFIKECVSEFDRVLCLGSETSRVLLNNDIAHFKLPHPSGLNRLNNDPIYIHKQLERCKNYLNGGSGDFSRELTSR
jgi:hypothetical protein